MPTCWRSRALRRTSPPECRTRPPMSCGGRWTSSSCPRRRGSGGSRRPPLPPAPPIPPPYSTMGPWSTRRGARGGGGVGVPARPAVAPSAADARALLDDGPVVVKERLHGPTHVNPLISSDPDEVARRLEEVVALGAQPLVQPVVRGRLM